MIIANRERDEYQQRVVALPINPKIMVITISTSFHFEL